MDKVDETAREIRDAIMRAVKGKALHWAVILYDSETGNLAVMSPYPSEEAKRELLQLALDSESGKIEELPETH